MVHVEFLLAVHQRLEHVAHHVFCLLLVAEQCACGEQHPAIVLAEQQFYRLFVLHLFYL